MKHSTKLEATPKGFWKVKENMKKFFDWAHTQLEYECMDDWYGVTQEELHKLGGVGLLANYNGSPSAALQAAYPEHKWDLTRFINKPSLLLNNSNKLFMRDSNIEKKGTGFWDNRDNQATFFEWIIAQQKSGLLTQGTSV